MPDFTGLWLLIYAEFKWIHDNIRGPPVERNLIYYVFLAIFLIFNLTKTY